METFTNLPLDPLGEVPVNSTIAALPKADVHLHQEWSPRLDRVLARREGHAPYDWRAWATQLMAEVPPGMPRLARLAKVFPASAEADAEPANFIARIEDLLEEGAADGAILIEMRFGGATALQHPDFMALFREAERRVRVRYPALRAEAAYTLLTWDEPERLAQVVAACLRATREGLGGIDLQYIPYDTEAEWTALASSGRARGRRRPGHDRPRRRVLHRQHRRGAAAPRCDTPGPRGLRGRRSAPARPAGGARGNRRMLAQLQRRSRRSPVLRRAPDSAVCRARHRRGAMHRRPGADLHDHRARVRDRPRPRLLARRAGGLYSQRHPRLLRPTRA